MNANPLEELEVITGELRRVKRLAMVGILSTAVSLAVAVVALVTPYNAALRAYVERVEVLSKGVDRRVRSRRGHRS